MYCKNCGSEIKNGSSFCSSCGARVAVNNNSGYQYSAVQNNNAYTQQMQLALINKLKSVKSKALAGAIMCFVSAFVQILSGAVKILIPLFGNLFDNGFDFMDSDFQSNARLWTIFMTSGAIQSLIIAIISFIPMYKKYRGISALLNKIQFEYNQAEVDAFFSNYKTGFMQLVRVLSIWQCLGIISIPIYIAQVIASFAIINLKNDYNNMMMQYNNYCVNQYS